MDESNPSWFQTDERYNDPEPGTIKFSHSERMIWMRSELIGLEWQLFLWPSVFLGPGNVDRDQEWPRYPLQRKRPALS